MPANPFKKTEIDQKIIETLKDNDKATRQYLLQVFGLQMVERITFALLVGGGSAALALLLQLFGE